MRTAWVGPLRSGTSGLGDTAAFNPRGRRTVREACGASRTVVSGRGSVRPPVRTGVRGVGRSRAGPGAGRAPYPYGSRPAPEPRTCRRTGPNLPAPPRTPGPPGPPPYGCRIGSVPHPPGPAPGRSPAVPHPPRTAAEQNERGANEERTGPGTGRERAGNGPGTDGRRGGKAD
ncbi:hypothetical protein FQU76_15245 [Streptomyces qinzhouensis]|uniref:Uncharacterized protein n=1 Tax=Streptomyces qinzhouensis TaxID=2599401 RepID=A0A5B8J779_9ACTN|nr:hypothetical protein FQU76_15245 [Streptomyces qinzhouensis]